MCILWATFNGLGGLYMCICVVYMYVTIIITGEVVNLCWREKWEWRSDCNDVNRVLCQKFSRKIIKMIFIITRNIFSNFGNADVTSCLSACLPPVTLGLSSLLEHWTLCFRKWNVTPCHCLEQVCPLRLQRCHGHLCQWAWLPWEAAWPLAALLSVDT